MSNFTKVDPLVHEVRVLLSNFQTFSWGWHGRLLDGSILILRLVEDNESMGWPIFLIFCYYN